MSVTRPRAARVWDLTWTVASKISTRCSVRRTSSWRPMSRHGTEYNTRPRTRGSPTRPSALITKRSRSGDAATSASPGGRPSRTLSPAPCHRGCDERAARRSTSTVRLLRSASLSDRCPAASTPEAVTNVGHLAFNARFVLRFQRSRRVDQAAVVLSELGARPVEFRVEDVRSDHSGLQVVRHQPGRDRPEELERGDMRFDPGVDVHTDTGRTNMCRQHANTITNAHTRRARCVTGSTHGPKNP